MKVSLEDIVSLAKRRGFIYPSSDIYGGMAGVYDYGPLGVKLKRNIQDVWLQQFVDGAGDMYQVDAGILMNKKVWEASGHATGFNDPMVECSNCHSRLRADHVEDDKCPVCGKTGTLGKSKEFNMMFRTFVGPTWATAEHDISEKIAANKIQFVGKDSRIVDEFSIKESTTADSLAVYEKNSMAYLRPETAQGIFVNFKNVLDSFYPDVPFGIAQIGKAFRNEISPREFLFRLREMEQMEIEYFVPEKDWEKYFEKWRKDTHAFFKKIGLPEDKVHENNITGDDLAHYSKKTIDFEFDFPFGRRELSGLAYRTDYDLKHHQEASGKSMEYRPKDNSKPFVPHVIEPSFGLDRAVLAVLSNAYTEDEVGGERRVYMKFNPAVAPVKVAVCPLAKNKPELVAKAKEVYKTLQKEVGNALWIDTGNIGKNYRRADEIGVPKFITVDFETLDNNTVTLRNRDTTEQQRVKVDELTNSL